MLNKNVLPFLLLSCLIACFSCKKEETGAAENPPADTGLVCDAGTPQGEAVTRSIGADGGTLKTTDNRLQITVPAGALSANQTIQIQAITNTNPGGVGLAYRITPHGTTFSKPVTLTFRYENAELTGSVPQALCIATQNSKGVWIAPAGVQRDTTAHTVSLQTTHFSDWGFMESFRLTPEQAFVEPGASQELEVEQFFAEDILAPLTKDAEVIAPKSASGYIKQWNLGGEGNLVPLGAKATYKAPGSTPARNPVAVSVNMEYQGKPFLLVSNIYVAPEGFQFRINGGPWRRGTSYMGVVSGPAFFFAQATFAAKDSEDYAGQASITWPLSAKSETSYPWNQTTTGFFYSSQTGVEQYYQYFVEPSGKEVLSPGEVHIIRQGKVGEYVIGSFRMTRAGKVLTTSKDNPFVGVVSIEGFFKFKRSN